MRLRLLAAALVVGLVGAGCSGSPVAPTTPTAPIVDPPPIAPPSTPTPPPPKLSVTRFLAFGDSLTEGTISPVFQGVLTAGLPQSYPFKLQERLSAVYTGQTVVVLNGGLAGEKAADGVKRLPDVMRDAQPDVLLLMEGVNDLNAFSNLGNDAVGRVIGPLESMIKFARARGVRVFVATLPPQRAGGLRASSIAILPRFNQEVSKTALDEGATLVDVNTMFDVALIGQDGLHPTEAGYARLADIFLDEIKKAFEQPGSPLGTP